jgi:hypothetical protein
MRKVTKLDLYLLPSISTYVYGLESFKFSEWNIIVIYLQGNIHIQTLTFYNSLILFVYQFQAWYLFNNYYDGAINLEKRITNLYRLLTNKTMF